MTYAIQASPVIALDTFIGAAEAEVKAKTSKRSTTPAKSQAKDKVSADEIKDAGLLDEAKAAAAADRRAERAADAAASNKGKGKGKANQGKSQKATAASQPVETAIEVKAEVVAESMPANVTEIKPGVMIVRPSAESLQVEQKLNAEISTGLKDIAAKSTDKAKADKQPKEKGWKLPGGVIEPCKADELKAITKGSIMDVIVTLMVAGSTQAEFEAKGVGKGGNPFTYIREKKGYGCRKENDRFFVVFPEGITQPVYTPSKEEKKIDADAAKAAKAKEKADAKQPKAEEKAAS